MNINCKGVTCPLATTHDQYLDSLQRAYKRLSELDEETQQRISDKYYNSRRPWKQENPITSGER